MPHNIYLYSDSLPSLHVCLSFLWLNTLLLLFPSLFFFSKNSLSFSHLFFFIEMCQYNNGRVYSDAFAGQREIASFKFNIAVRVEIM